MSEKIIINKRNINDLIYKLFEDGRLDQIVRHFKIIINSNCIDEDENLILSQKTENFNGNVLYPSIDNVNNIIDDTIKIDFKDKHISINDIKEIINNHESIILNNYVDNIINSYFNNDENQKILDNLENDNIYIRCGVNPDDKQFYLLKLFELYIASYFNDLSSNAQNNLLDDNLLPMYNDTIFLGNNKYNFLVNKIKESKHKILNEFNENNN